MTDIFQRPARACMAAKCIQADADFYEEVAALVCDLSPAHRQQVIELVEADRETPDELKDFIEGFRLQERYDYLLSELRAIRPALVIIQGETQ